MKLSFILISIFIFSAISSFSVGKNIQLHLKENQELIYDYSNKEAIMLDTNFESITIQRKTFSIFINKVESEKVFFTARFLSYTEDVSNSRKKGFFDFRFPQLIYGFWNNTQKDISKEILYQIPFTFEIDLNTGNIQLTNRIDILEQSHQILKSKGYADDIRNSTILDINKTELGEQSKLFLLPFLFLNKNFEKTQFFQKELNMNFSITRNANKEIHFKSPTDSIKRIINGRLNANDGFLNHYSKELIKEFPTKNKKYPQIENRTFIKLVLKQNKLQTDNNLIVCGHFHNPVSKKICLYSINKEFGTEFDSKTVILDESGNFKIDVKLKEKGLVVISNPNNNSNVEGSNLLLYAEPGDSIYIDAKFKQAQLQKTDIISGDSVVTRFDEIIVPEKLTFSGDRKYEAELLEKFQWHLGFEPFKMLNNKFLYREYADDVLVYLGALSKFEALIADASKNIDSDACNYLNNELLTFLYSRLCILIPFIYIDRMPYLQFAGSEIPESVKESVNHILDTINVSHIYNDYGCFSRDFTEKFVNYKFRTISPIDQFIIGSSRFGYLKDPEQYFHFTKAVLFGSAFYREGARQLFDYTTAVFRDITQNEFQPFVDETFELMKKRCNDKTFIDAIDNFRKTKSEWEDSLYLPQTRFINLENKTTTLNSFLGKKPTIFFTSQNWSAGRYEIDEYAAKYPEMNFVLINEGSNFDLWKEWNDRADPVAHQLFLKTDSVCLEDVFLANMMKYIIYNTSGERIGIERSLGKAVSIAKESLVPESKELNKSTMIGIIWFLGGSLLVLFIALFVIKNRTRRKMKKQEQEKRLRELQLSAIRSQMNPHFLFNSLNSVQNLIQKDRAREAHLYLSDFAGLIRKVLKNSQREEISLAEELETLSQYIQLEKLRFDFMYDQIVDADIDKNNFMVPSMILQPIVENAIIHGLQHKQGDKKLTVSVKKKDDNILISVEDNGIGMEAARKLKTGSNGVGLKMNEERLKIMDEKYGGKYSIRIIDLFELGSEGTRVEISIPDEI